MLNYLSCVVIIMVGKGQAEIIELAAKQPLFFPRIDLTIFLNQSESAV